ncbi:MAG TPA: sigma-70 family RNA polymerase sigma factor [Myxococcales bacterium]|jgi:RNA polymerase sigma-70 factor (ECF subfamily)
MARYVEGDRRSFAQLFARWAPRLHGYFLRAGGSRGEADDLLQATFLRVHRARESFRGELGLRGWLFTIAARVRKDEVNRRLRNPSGADPAAAEEIAAPAEEDPAVANERAQAVRAALARLPEAQREVIYLHRYEHMRFGEIAAVLGISEGAVKLRAFRGYERLRIDLAAFFAEDQAA